MLWALENKVEVDAFVVYTDNETWCGKIHPIQALQKYREVTGIPAKLIVNAMTATKFTITKRTDRGFGTLYGGYPESVTDPSDGGMLDVAGFDSAAPKIMSDFIRD
jgi:60 kDa SS-A/Ro ribonucleoprotein